MKPWEFMRLTIREFELLLAGQRRRFRQDEETTARFVHIITSTMPHLKTRPKYYEVLGRLPDHEIEAAQEALRARKPKGRA